MHVWDLLAKKCVATLNGHHSTVTSMALSEDGTMLLTAGRDKVRLDLILGLLNTLYPYFK